MNDALDNLLSDFRYSLKIEFRGGPGSTICEITFGDWVAIGHGVNARNALEIATMHFREHLTRSKT